METFYVIQSEYVCNGVTFNRTRRNIKSLEQANAVFDEVLENMKYNNNDIIEDTENYVIEESNRKGKRYFSCYYKYQSSLSNFSVEMWSETLE